MVYIDVFEKSPNVYFFLECILENIGKPVFHRYSTDLYGSWMQDAFAREGEDGNKIWVTLSTDNRFEPEKPINLRHDLNVVNYLPVGSIS